MDNQNDDFDKMEGMTFDPEDVRDTDIKINPSYYIHNAIVKAQAALVKDDVQGGFLQFRVLVENAETMARAAKLLANEYEGKIEDYKKTDDHLKAENESVRSMRLANKKLFYIMEYVFAGKTNTKPIGDNERKLPA